MAHPKPVTIRGVIVPVAWDSQGRPAATGLAAVGEEEYLLGSGPQTQLLLGLVHQEVLVNGLVEVTPQGQKKISVVSFHLTGQGDTP